MKFSKIISNTLAIGLLFNTVSTSFAGVLSGDNRYETFEGNKITIDNILEEDKVDVEIEGNTLVNIYNKQEPKAMGGTLSNEDDIYRVTKDSSSNRGYLQFDISSTFFIKPGTLYTIILKNYFNNGDNTNIVLYDRTNGIRISDTISKSSQNILLKTKEDINNENRIQLLIYVGDTEATYVEVSNKIVLIEGDYINQNIDYFEGIKSVGQDDENGHNIEVISSSKNLIDIKQIKLTEYGILEDNSITVLNPREGEFDYAGSIEIKVDNSWIGKQFRLSSNISGLGQIEIRQLDKNNKQIYVYTDNNHTFTIEPNCTLLKFTFSSRRWGVTATWSNIQLEEGDTFTGYTPYQSDKVKIQLNEPLRALPNGTKDRIIKKNGQWVIERNCASIVLNGDEPIFKELDHAPANTNFTRYNIKDIDGIIAGQEGVLLSDKLPYIYIHSAGSTNIELECISNQSNIDDYLNIVIKKSRLTSDTVEGFREWLSNNPITVVYKLAEPIYEPINTNLSVQLFEDTTYISNSSNIPANIKVTVDRAINRATEAIELAKTNPTILNISRARMWSNLLKESIKKDELHTEINNITNIEDLQLERKTATSNIDVYIKSENMLLMSLSTNNITFNDFSGVEDMELGNAINISINSSLPYQLNSYLLSEIENSDNSSRIEKDLLNIKINKDSDYKTFVDINEKLILEDDCDAGNNKSHSIDLRLKGSQAHKADVYKTVIKFEAEQK